MLKANQNSNLHLMIIKKGKMVLHHFTFLNYLKKDYSIIAPTFPISHLPFFILTGF